MSFDIYGRAPTSEEGKYFCRNHMGWVPITEYILTVAPDIAAKCKYWDTNDGDGLDAEHAVALADRLDAEIQSGRPSTTILGVSLLRQTHRTVPAFFGRKGHGCLVGNQNRGDRGLWRVPCRGAGEPMGRIVRVSARNAVTTGVLAHRYI
jgi:hypothetical protein